MEDRRGAGEALEGLKRLEISARTSESLGGYTTMRVGGVTPLFVEPGSEREVELALSVLREAWDGDAPLVLGRGSNLLPCDHGMARPVLFTGRLGGIEYGGNGRVRVGGGAPLAKVLSLCLKLGLEGLEPLSGIPATLGGMVAMNAGAFGRCIGDLVERVRLITFGGECLVLKGGDVEWGYRASSLKGMGVVTEVVLGLVEGGSLSVRREIARFSRMRAEKQPLGLPSAGSVFKNPGSAPAGVLIERAGLKGSRVGGAAVSRKHANFIVNLGGATCTDVLGLVEVVKRKVLDVFGIELEEEIEYVC